VQVKDAGFSGFFLYIEGCHIAGAHGRKMIVIPVSGD
jgi:hypothetical protein